MTIKKVFYRSPHNYDQEEASNDATVQDFGPSMTVQSMAEDADINVIVQRFGLTGKMPDNPRIPTFQDFEDIGDFRTAIESVKLAQEAFNEYPAELRGRFLNDPQRFMAFCADPANKDDMRKLGLLKPIQEAPRDPNASVVEAITSLRGIIQPVNGTEKGDPKPVT